VALAAAPLCLALRRSPRRAEEAVIAREAAKQRAHDEHAHDYRPYKAAIAEHRELRSANDAKRDSEAPLAYQGWSAEVIGRLAGRPTDYGG
jgi:hypothetical protein